MKEEFELVKIIFFFDKILDVKNDEIINRFVRFVFVIDKIRGKVVVNKFLFLFEIGIIIGYVLLVWEKMKDCDYSYLI